MSTGVKHLRRKWADRNVFAVCWTRSQIPCIIPYRICRVAGAKQLALECRRQATSGKPKASNQPRTHRIRCFTWHCIYLVALYECAAVCDCLWLFVAVCDCLLLCVVVCGCGCLWWCGCVGVWVLLRLAACIFEFVGAFRVF